MTTSNVKKITKFEFNKYIVGQRGSVRQGINHAINKLTREADRYRRKKTVNDQQKEKNVRRADRYIEELQYIKSLHPDDVTKFAVLCKKTYKDVGSNPNSSIEERALTRLSEHKHIQPAIKKFQDEHPNWSAEVPDIIKSLGVNYRKKRLKTLAAKGKLDPVMEKERKLFLILHEAAGLDVDPKMLQSKKSVISLNKKKKETSKESKPIKKKIEKFISEEEEESDNGKDIKESEENYDTAYESEDVTCNATDSYKNVAVENSESDDDYYDATDAKVKDYSEDADGRAIEAEENDNSEDSDAGAFEAEEKADSEDSDGGAIEAEENDDDSEDSDAIEAEENDDSEDSDGGAIEAEENDDSEDSDAGAIEAEENDDSEDSDAGAIKAEENDDSEDSDCGATISITDDKELNCSKVMGEPKKKVKEMKLSNKNKNHKIKCDESISIVNSLPTKNVVAKRENDLKSQINSKELSQSSHCSKKLHKDKKISKDLKLKLLQSLESKGSENFQNSSPGSNQNKRRSFGIIDSIFSNFNESKLQKNKNRNFFNSKSNSIGKRLPIKSVIKGTCQVKQIDLRNKADLIKDPMNAILSKKDNSNVSDDDNYCNPDSLNLKRKKSSFFLGYQGNDVEDSDKESYINDDFNGVNSIKGKINKHENRSSFFRTSLSNENNTKTNDNSATNQNQYNDGLNRFERRRQKFGALEHHRGKRPFYNNKGSSTEDFLSEEPHQKLQKSEFGNRYHEKKDDRSFRNMGGGKRKFNKNRMSSFQNSGSNSMPLGDRQATYENKAPQESLLHPSWAAKKKEAQLSSAINAFQGKRVTFDD